VVTYKVNVLPKAVRVLAKLPRDVQERIGRRIDALASGPRPLGVEHVVPTSFLRIRVGDYRVVYGVNDAAQEITVVIIGHRREVYRGF
jgi:mRNA interferase RelE/StbE